MGPGKSGMHPVVTSRQVIRSRASKISFFIFVPYMKKAVPVVERELVLQTHFSNSSDSCNKKLSALFLGRHAGEQVVVACYLLLPVVTGDVGAQEVLLSNRFF